MSTVRKRKILRYLGSHFKRTRHVASLARQCEMFVEMGYEICIVLSKPPENRDWLNQFERIGVQFAYVDRPRFAYDMKCVASVYTLCRKFRPDIIHCENIHLLPLLGARLAGVKVRIWHKRAMNRAAEELRTHSFREKIGPNTRLSTFLASRIICVSRLVAAELLEYGVQREKLIVFNNANDGNVRLKETADLSLRQSLGLSTEDIVAVTVGHAVPVKGWPELISGFAEIASEAPRLVLVLVGSVDDPHELETMSELRLIIDEHSISRRIIFAGHMDSVDKPLGTADFFVLSSRAEGFCNALIEAYARGIPCISTAVGIAPELIEDGVSGYLVARGDSSALGKAMRDLALDKEKRMQIRKNTYLPDWVLSKVEYNRALAHIYQTLLEENVGSRA